MSETYDREILHINVNLAIDSLKCITHNYKLAISEKWRFERLLRELGEFRLAIWGERLPSLAAKED